MKHHTVTAAAQPASDRQAVVPRRWTLHGLNNGAIFSATRRRVGILPRFVSYAIGHGGPWLAWRAMRSTRQAVADKLAAVFPGEPRPALERRALATLRAYARDTIDFTHALDAGGRDRERLFETTDAQVAFFEDLRGRGKGVILVTGHYGNWEVGGVLFSLRQYPFTVVAMAEADPTVNRIRHEIRDR